MGLLVSSFVIRGGSSMDTMASIEPVVFCLNSFTHAHKKKKKIVHITSSKLTDFRFWICLYVCVGYYYCKMIVFCGRKA